MSLIVSQMHSFVSGPDGTISHKTSGIEIGQKGFKDGMREFSIDPRDIEVCMISSAILYE